MPSPSANAADYYSYVNMVLLFLLGGAGSLVLALLGYWASDVNKRLKDQQATLNEHTVKLGIAYDWSQTHDDKDDERHSENKTRLEDNFRAIQSLRGDLTGWRQPHRLKRDEEDNG